MRFIFLIIFIGGFFVQLPAQLPPNGNLQENKIIQQYGSIQGRTFESLNNSELPYVSLLLFQIKNDSLVSGTISNENGFFTIGQVPFGTYKLKATSIGYDSLIKIIRLEVNTLEVGDLFLKSNESLLQAVTISGEKSQIELHPDKKVINVDKDISAKGGTALDALKNAPGITVNENDEILLRNNVPIIYVDGKPTTLTMRQIPADQINTIEIITNPTAKYDAAATGGIINITLKENKKPGYNGLLNAGFGTNDQISGMAMFNVKEIKWATSLSYNFNSAKNSVDGISNRDNLYDGLYNGGSYQDVSTIFTRQFHFGRLGFDYFINNRNSISISKNIVSGKFSIDETQATTELNSAFVLNGSSLQKNIQHIQFTNNTTAISFIHTYPVPEKKYTTTISYNRSVGRNDYNYTTNNFDAAGILQPNNPELQLIGVNNNSQILTAQYDFINPLNSYNNLELGFKANWTSSASNQDAFEYNYLEYDYQTDSILSTKYKTDEIIFALYTTYSGKIKNLNYMAGLRFESSNYYVVYNDTGKFSYNLPSNLPNLYYAFFPSLNLSYKVNSANEFQFNISRKITRPNMFQSSPFLFAGDKYNYRIGNPLLKPEFVNTVELVHNYQSTYFNLFTTFYGKYNEHPITPYSYFLDTTQQILVNTFANADKGYSYGIEPSISISKIKNLSINTSANIFYSYSGDIGTQVVGEAGWSWDAKINVGYKLPKQFALQVNGSYEAPKYISQGRILSLYGADISISKEIKTWTASLALNDIFDTREMRIEYDQPEYYQIQSRRRDTRFLRLTVAYRFGKVDNSIFKGRGTETPPINSNDGY